MKYNILNQAIPQNSRRELNDKILYLIDNDLAESSGITKEDISYNKGELILYCTKARNHTMSKAQQYICRRVEHG